ncbi:MAG: hypothetical protein RIG84_19110 [Roseovarius sp.]
MSKPMAGSCSAEKARAEKLEKSVHIWPSKRQVKVGDALEVKWSGNDLEERIPIWIMISTDRPTRFDGDGFFALGPDSPNPFGMTTGMGAQRAIIALHARGAGERGSVSILPLEAEDLKVTMQLVTYLRACEVEVVLSSATRDIKVLPGEANVVLPDQMPNGNTLFRVALDKFNRVVSFNETRIRIVAGNGSEILNRAGTGVSFSPTTRFLSTVHNDQIEIVDVVDGATVARLDIGELSWAFDDALAMTNVIPWGEVSIVSTLGAPLKIIEQVTGPACCPAQPENTKVMISLENAAFGIWGSSGHIVGSLQVPRYRHQEAPRGAYSSQGTGSKALFAQILASIGPVSPLSLETGFHVPDELTITFSLAGR